jgi:hypothetical protein
MKQVAVNTDPRQKSFSRLETRLHAAFWQNDVYREPVGNAIAHHLESALRLLRFTRIERQSKLDETIRRQVEFSAE